MALDRSADSLLVFTSGDDGQALRTVDLDSFTASPPAPPSDAEMRLDALGSDSGGTFGVLRNDDDTIVLASEALDEPVELASSASASATGARGIPGERTWYVAGTDFSGSPDTATLWTYDEVTDSLGTPVELGAAGTPDHSVLSLAVDPVDDVAYALTFRDNDDAPQSYGITVVQDGPDAYVPLEYTYRAVALSPDGETLYATRSNTVTAFDAERLAEGEAESALDGVSVTDWVSALAVDDSGNVFVASEDGVVSAFATPAAPGDRTATPHSMSTTGFSASWDEGEYYWERDDNDPPYLYTVRDADGGVVERDTVWAQQLSVEDLTPGVRYTLEVQAPNGLQLSTATSIQVTTHGRYVTAPSAITIQGSLTVGSQLSVAATGAWEAGTEVSYEWYASDGESGGRIGEGPTFTLTASHLGLMISVGATGTKAGVAGLTVIGRAPGTVTNPPVVTPPAATPPVASTPAPPAALQKLKATKPKVTGPAKVGKTLTVSTGTWTKGAKLSYQWLANGKAIKGATGAKLKLTKALRGKKISVTVTGKKAGYTAATLTSGQTAKVRR